MRSTAAEGLNGRALAGYAAAAAELVDRYDALDTEAIFAPVAGYLPRARANVLDVGAGTGRDAAWFARRGHQVTAVEPVAALRRAGRERHREPITWIGDRLPHLSSLRTGADRFDCATVIGVWQHLEEAERAQSLSALAALLVPGGRLMLYLRHGPESTADRPVAPIDMNVTRAQAEAAGLIPAFECETTSVQVGNRALGVHWTWLVLDRR